MKLVDPTSRIPDRVHPTLSGSAAIRGRRDPDSVSSGQLLHVRGRQGLVVRQGPDRISENDFLSPDQYLFANHQVRFELSTETDTIITTS